jgi:hypothetical protein
MIKLPVTLSCALVAFVAGCTHETQAGSHGSETSGSDLGDYSRMAWSDFVTATNRGLTGLDERVAELKVAATKTGTRSAAEIDTISGDLSRRTSELRATLAGAKEDVKAAGRSVRDDISAAFSTLKRDIESSFR